MIRTTTRTKRKGRPAQNAPTSTTRRKRPAYEAEYDFPEGEYETTEYSREWNPRGYEEVPEQESFGSYRRRRTQERPYSESEEGEGGYRGGQSPYGAGYQQGYRSDYEPDRFERERNPEYDEYETKRYYDLEEPNPRRERMSRYGRRRPVWHSERELPQPSEERWYRERGQREPIRSIRSRGSRQSESRPRSRHR